MAQFLIDWLIDIRYLQELYIRRIYRFTAEVCTYSSAKNPPKGWGFELGTYPGAGRQCSMTLSHTSVSSSSINSLKVLLKLSYLDIFEPMCEISAILIIWLLTGHLVYTYKYMYIHKQLELRGGKRCAAGPIVWSLYQGPRDSHE